MINKKFDYDDINLIPKKCIVNSRTECDTSFKLSNYTFKLPVVPANMESVLDVELAIKLAKNGYFYIMHRFDIDTLSFIDKMNELGLIVSISIGVNNDSYGLIDDIKASNRKVDFITIDIAHGHSIKMERMLKYIKNILPDIFVIAGNISTAEARADLEDWGADATKVGIGPGCFLPFSEIITQSGKKTLSEIKVGDYVLTHNNRFRKVLAKHHYLSEYDMVKINNLPMCTETHEFYVTDNKDVNNQVPYWLAANKLTSDNKLIVKKAISKIDFSRYSNTFIDTNIEDNDIFYDDYEFIICNIIETLNNSDKIKDIRSFNKRICEYVDDTDKFFIYDGIDKEYINLHLNEDGITIDDVIGYFIIKRDGRGSYNGGAYLYFKIKDLEDAFVQEMEVATTYIDITKIQKLNYYGEVIDLTVEEDESYNIEGVIVHNSACTTFPSTLFGSRNCQAYIVYECAKSAKKPIIADGGIKKPGDITASLVLGATLVMVGGMLSGFNDSPGDLIEKEGKMYKEYWGSASQRQSGKSNRIEGKITLQEFKYRSILDELKYLEECLQSSISYGGGNNLDCLNNVKWI